MRIAPASWPRPRRAPAPPSSWPWLPGQWAHRGELRENGRSISIDGLWALEFGNGANAGPRNNLFFTAGPDDESHGLFGKITAG